VIDRDEIAELLGQAVRLDDHLLLARWTRGDQATTSSSFPSPRSTVLLPAVRLRHYPGPG
jgi:hypothetical protein